MIPFERSWPYDVQMKDVLAGCPFCGRDNVLLPLHPSDLKTIADGAKKLLVFPCCHNRVTVLDADKDYLLMDVPVRSL